MRHPDLADWPGLQRYEPGEHRQLRMPPTPFTPPQSSPAIPPLPLAPHSSPHLPLSSRAPLPITLSTPSLPITSSPAPPTYTPTRPLPPNTTPPAPTHLHAGLDCFGAALEPHPNLPASPQLPAGFCPRSGGFERKSLIRGPPWRGCDFCGACEYMTKVLSPGLARHPQMAAHSGSLRESSPGWLYTHDIISIIIIHCKRPLTLKHTSNQRPTISNYVSYILYCCAVVASGT